MSDLHVPGPPEPGQAPGSLPPTVHRPYGSVPPTVHQPYGSVPSGVHVPSAPGAYGGPVRPPAGYHVPGYAPAARPRPSSRRPESVNLAVLLLYVGAAMNWVGLGVTLLTKDEIRRVVRRANPMSSQASVEAAVNLGLASAAVGASIGAFVWMWMARANGAGKGWARVLITIFFCLSIGTQVLSQSQPQPPISRFVAAMQFLIGLAVIVCVYTPAANRFYAERAGRR